MSANNTGISSKKTSFFEVVCIIKNSVEFTSHLVFGTVIQCGLTPAAG